MLCAFATNRDRFGEPSRDAQHPNGRVYLDLRLESRGTTRKELRHRKRNAVMVEPSPRTLLLQLNETDQLGTLTIDATDFDAFEQELELSLERLVETWKHLASPNANRTRLGRNGSPIR